MTYPIMFLNTFSFRIEINSIPIGGLHLITPPYTLPNILSQIGSISGGYIFTATNYGGSGSRTSCTAPAGMGSSANGYVIRLGLWTPTAYIGSVIYTLEGGVDEFDCPDVIIPTDRLLQANGNYILQANDDFINLAT